MDRLLEVKGALIEECFRAIKGNDLMPLFNFDYASHLTEMVLLGALDQRTGRTIEWNAANMRVLGQPELGLAAG